MDKHFPNEIQAMIHQSKAKAAFISDIAPNNPNDCLNCGGAGWFALFIADEGPYQSPAAPYRSDHKTSHWHDGKWWIGKTYTFPCPDCNSLGKQQTQPVHYIQQNLEDDYADMIERIAP